MKKLLINTVVMLSLATLSACGQATTAPLPTPTATFLPLILLPTQAATTQLPTLTVQPLPTATSSPIVPIEAEIVFDNYLLRTGPGRMFGSVGMYAIGDRVTLLGREPGNNWVLVQTTENYSGWMNVVGLSLIGDVTPLPVFTITNAQVLHGRVWNTNKTPATKVGVSIDRVNNPSPDLQDNSPSNLNGEWYIYVPLDFDGDWVVGVNSYSCDSSAVDNPTSCALIGKIPSAQLITLPLQADVNLEFALQP